MEDLNAWVMTAAGWITVIKTTVWLVKKWLPKVRESLKMWRSCRRKH